MKNKNRFLGLDIIRILSGFGVVLLHVTDSFIIYPPYAGIGGSSWWIINVINVMFRISVPLFIIISGYLLLNSTSKLDALTFYKKRFTKIGIPTIFWIIFYLLLLWFIGQQTTLMNLLKDLLSLNILHLYFLFLILELYFVLPFFRVFLQNSSSISRKTLLISLFVITFITTGTNYLFPDISVNLTRNIITVFIPFLFYFLSGLFLKKRHFSVSGIISLIIIYIYMSVFIAVYTGSDVLAYTRNFNSITIMIMAFIAFIIFYQADYINFFKNEKLIKIISNISNLIFGIYLVHVAVMMLIDYLYPVIPGNVGNPIWIYVIIKVLIVFIVSMIITFILKKIPYMKNLV